MRFPLLIPHRAVAAAFAAILIVLAGPASAQPVVPVSDPEVILARVMERNPTLQSFEASVHVDLHMTSFPFLAPKLDGHSYFKRPNSYEVVFERMPSYAKNFSRLYSDIGDPSSWTKRFTIAVVGERTIEKHRDIELRMVQRVRGMIDHESVFVDPEAWAIDEIDYHYYNGGTIAMTQTFRSLGGYSVIAEQHVNVAIPHVHAVGTAVYSGYRTNVALDDSVFEKTR